MMLDDDVDGGDMDERLLPELEWDATDDSLVIDELLGPSDVLGAEAG